jgi:hypothetical protein
MTTLYDGKQAVVSDCENFLINKYGKQYCLWKRKAMSLNVATGQKKTPFMPMQLNVYCQLLKMGTKAAVKKEAQNESEKS